MNDVADRIESEAAFQDGRALNDAPEPRDKYYFLMDRAGERYRSALGDVNGRRVLVVGCSDGGVTPLARRGANVTGIDVSPEAIKKLRRAIAKERLDDRAEASVMNAEAADFPSASFDLICCTGVLHHLEIEPAVRAWTRILKRDGSVVMLEPMAWNPVVALYRWATPESRTADEHPLKPADIRILKQFFRNVRVEGFVLFSTLAAVWAFVGAPSIRRRVVEALEALDDAALAIVPPLRYCCWTSVIQCSDPIER